MNQMNKIMYLLEQGITPAYAFPQVGILSYSRRISDLRERGYNIKNHKQTIDGQVRSSYELIREK